ncbi:ABC transporter ATP-binding protein [Zavarzinia compransoris]|uniref:Iron ABC transporter n=1 Tax=Zavarzinia compransoris TaxID=1264899 RepID=A0A317DYB4_9PROT|nr:ABC transporter ATP-binding protein [Zavarzinia compransoris]PWR17835.1 iron ABC transporter [Zavarzinia compransoris]TDP49369.1 iron complex transport system ATP-binding protein [Zavarzinia compransoris]
MALAFEVRGLSVGYRRRPVIRELSLSPLAGGQVVALLGPNAAGKTTLMRGLAGLLPARGSIRLDGRELIGLAPAAHARHVGYMPQTLPQGVSLSLFESVLGALRANGLPGGSARTAREQALATIELVGLGALALRPLAEMSGGQRQLASLAQAIVRAPEVLLLDEPTSALDPRHQFEVMRLIRSQARAHGLLAIVVCHDIALACRWADRVVVLDPRGLAAEGPAAEVITPEVLARVYGIVARVERCARGYLQVMVDDTV